MEESNLKFRKNTCKRFIEQDNRMPLVPFTGKVIDYPYDELDKMERYLLLSDKVCDGQGPYLNICEREKMVDLVHFKEPPTLAQAILEASIRNLPLFLQCEQTDEFSYANTIFREIKLS